MEIALDPKGGVVEYYTGNQTFIISIPYEAEDVEVPESEEADEVIVKASKDEDEDETEEMKTLFELGD